MSKMVKLNLINSATTLIVVVHAAFVAVAPRIHFKHLEMKFTQQSTANVQDEM
jgi:hypothetical protein